MPTSGFAGNRRYWTVGTCLLALGLVGAALAVRLVLFPEALAPVSNMPFFVAAMLAAVIGGFRAGLVATVANVLCIDYFLLEPKYSLAIAEPRDRLALVVHAVLSVALSWLIVSVQRRSEERANKQLVATLESLNDAFTKLDKDWRVVYMNRVGEQISREPRANYLGKTLWEHWPDVEGTEIESEFRRAMTERITVDFEFYYQPLEVWLDFKVHPTPDGGLAVFTRDISERKRAQAAQMELQERILEERERVQTVADAVPALIAYIDPTAHYRLVNHAHELWFGRPSGEFVGLDVRSVVGDAAWAKMRGPLTNALAGNTVSFEAELTNHDGSSRWIVVTYVPDMDENHNARGVVAHISDVTDLKRAEFALQEADRRKDEFLATLAHELRNPLAPVRNALELMKQSPDNPEVLELARETMERQMTQMVRIIDDLLDVNRISRNKLELRREIVELAQVVQQAEEIVRPLCNELHHHLTIEIPSDPVYLDADPVRLTQVFVNLLTNAAKYTDCPGNIRLEAKMGSEQLVISVVDDGLGITPDLLPRIFDMFVQEERSVERRDAGLGIGLSLVKRLVELHGGEVTASSAGSGKGSEFVVCLPVTEKPPAHALNEVHDSRPEVSRKVLVVDDNVDSARTLSLLLQVGGHVVTIAYEGPEAIKCAEAMRPDVIFLDIGLPGLSGHDVCRAIRAEPWGRDMAVIALTGWGQEEDRRKSNEAGFDAHLVKPVDGSALLRLVNETLAARA